MTAGGRVGGGGENTLKATLAGGGIAVGGEIATELPWMAAAFAQSGLDFAWIDLEHSLLDLQTVGVHVRTARLAGVTPIVRVPSPDVPLIRRLIDNGAQGIVVPFVEEPATAETLVAACRFHPSGRRGAADPRPANDFEAVSLAEHVARDDRDLLRCVQIESAAGVDASEAIAAVAGIDVVVVGLADLSVSLGYPGAFDHPTVIEAADRVIATCRSYGVSAGIAGGYAASTLAEAAAAWRARGAQFFHVLSDVGLLTAALDEHARLLGAIRTSPGANEA